MKVSNFVGKTIKEIFFEETDVQGGYLMLIKFEDDSMIMTHTKGLPFYRPDGEYAEDDIPRITFGEFFKKFD